MNLLNQAPWEVKSIVCDYLVPLFLLYNILGWVGLSGREAARSQTPPTPEDSAALGKSIWAAWWLGVLLSLAGITAGLRFLGSCPKDQNVPGWEVLIAGAEHEFLLIVPERPFVLLAGNEARVS